MFLFLFSLLNGISFHFDKIPFLWSKSFWKGSKSTFKFPRIVNDTQFTIFSTTLSKRRREFQFWGQNLIEHWMISKEIIHQDPRINWCGKRMRIQKGFDSKVKIRYIQLKDIKRNKRHFELKLISVEILFKFRGKKEKNKRVEKFCYFLSQN